MEPQMLIVSQMPMSEKHQQKKNCGIFKKTLLLFPLLLAVLDGMPSPCDTMIAKALLVMIDDNSDAGEDGRLETPRWCWYLHKSEIKHQVLSLKEGLCCRGKHCCVIVKSTQLQICNKIIRTLASGARQNGLQRENPVSSVGLQERERLREAPGGTLLCHCTKCSLIQETPILMAATREWVLSISWLSGAFFLKEALQSPILTVKSRGTGLYFVSLHPSKCRSPLVKK